MEIMLKIGIPFSVLLMIVGCSIYLGGKFKQELISRIIVALICLVLCFYDIYLLAYGPIEIQVKKYIVALSMVLTIYIVALIFNLIRAQIVYGDMKEAKSEYECVTRIQQEKIRQGGEK